MDHLGVFAKFWQPGEVKTRLGREIGFDGAADLYRVMLDTTLNRLGELGDLRTIAFAPPERGGEFIAVAGSRWCCKPQAAGDLGARMAAFATGQLAAGADRVVILGTDSPHVPLAWIDEAFDLLRQYDVVLGPTTDGGYYLVGMRSHVPPIFDEMPWSTTEVFSRTVARLAASDHSFAVLSETFDVDDTASLRLLDEYLKQQQDTPAFDSLRSAVAAALTVCG